MIDANQTRQWLTDYQTDGVNLSIGELLQFRHHIKALDLTPKRLPQARLSGTYVTKIKGRGMEFDESRHYQAGDDIRAIDWRVTARTGKTHTKVYREERERPVYIFTDLSTSMQFGSQFVFKAVQASHLAALVAWSAAARGDKVGGISFNQQQHFENKPLSRQSAVLRQLHNLVTLQSNAVRNSQIESAVFNNACARLMRLVKPGSMVWLISDFHGIDEKSAALIADMNRHCEVRACVISDPLERGLPQVNVAQSLSVTDGQNEQQLLLGDKKTEQDYASWSQRRLLHLTQLLSKANISAMSLDAGLPLLSQKLTPLRINQLEQAG